jgi:hypothetical protein
MSVFRLQSGGPADPGNCLIRNDEGREDYLALHEALRDGRVPLPIAGAVGGVFISPKQSRN